MWYACLAVLIAVLVGVAWRRGPNLALGTTAVLALVFPAWLWIDLGGVRLDLRIAAAGVALVSYCFHPKSEYYPRLVLVDIAAIAVLIVHVASDWLNDGLDWFVPLRAYGEWGVPYLLGRLSLQHWRHVRGLVGVVLGVNLLLAVLGIVETTTQLNLFETVFGIREDPEPRYLTRWGLHRAFGPLHNPIYFGTLQLLLYPWSLYAAALASRKDGPRWWLAAPVASAIGIGTSLSRAPILGLVPLAFASVFVLKTKWRPALSVGAVVAVGLLVMQRDRVLDQLHRWAGEPGSDKRVRITVDDEQVEYTSTLHRFYLLKVYGNAMRKGGWLGYGTEATSTFPPNVPVGDEHVDTLKRLWAIDNEYVLLILRFGYLGVAAFVALPLAAVAAYAQLGKGQGLRIGVFCASMAGALVAVLFVLITVWMPHDFGFWILWTAGSAAGLQATTRASGGRQHVGSRVRLRGKPETGS